MHPIYLIRHADPWSASELSSRGIKQAKQISLDLVERLEDKPKIITGPLHRTLETAKLIKTSLDQHTPQYSREQNKGKNKNNQIELEIDKRLEIKNYFSKNKIFFQT